MGDEIHPYPLNRFLQNDAYEVFCPFGHAIPEDLLEGVGEIKHPTVLILESGDLQTLFYTLWKNFGPYGGDTYSGASFLITDSHPAIVARNVMFLYLSLQAPEGKEELKRWMGAVWAIWFCHELHQEHEKVLRSALQPLIRWTDSSRLWTDSHQNPLRAIVRFAHPSTLSKVNAILKMWYNREVHLPWSISEFKEHRIAENRRRMGCDHRVIPFVGLAASYGFMQRQCPPPLHRKNEESYDAYFFSGSIFAEHVLSLPALTSETTLNITFFETAEGRYTVDFNSIPQQGFSQAFTFSPSEMARIGLPTSSLLVDDEEAFDYDTFLVANSVQQFSLWLLGVGKILSRCASRRQSSITLAFRCSDSLEFCQQLQMSPNVYVPQMGFDPLFDVIYTSKHLTHYPPPNLLFSTFPLLKQNGYLIMNILVYRQIAPTGEQLLEVLFAFDPRLLPILCGARCIGHEAEYSSPITDQLAPWSYATAALLTQSPKVMWWRKVQGLPLKLFEFTKDMEITRVLSTAMITMMQGFHHSHPIVKAVPYLTTQIAVGLIRSFAMQLDAEIPVGSCQFWEPLCSLLRESEKAQSYLLPLEVHTHLIGIHLHLTVTKKNCPLCNKVPLSDYLTTYVMEIPKEESEHLPTFMVYVHDSPSSDILELKLLQTVGGACHIFDCLDVTDLGGRYRLQFIAPRHLTEGHYATVICFNIPVGDYSQGLVSIPKNVQHGLLKDFLGPPSHYTFKKFRNKSYLRSSSFGKVTHHYGNGVTFETVVSLSEGALSTLDRVTLNCKSISDSALEIMCGKHVLRINYPHLVHYPSVKIKLSRKHKTVSVTAPRKAHMFYDDKPLVTVNPDFKYGLLSDTMKQAVIATFLAMQFTKADRVIIEAKVKREDLVPDLLKIKEHFCTLFQSFRKHFFQIVVTDTEHVCLVVLHRHLMDLTTQIPAVDLSFCFSEPSLINVLSLRWQKMVPADAAHTLSVRESAYPLLQKIFNHYARRTRPSAKAVFSERQQQLVKHRLSKWFTRAVVFPMFSDPDVYIQDMGIDKALQGTAFARDDKVFLQPTSQPPKEDMADMNDHDLESKLDPDLVREAMAMASRVQKRSEEFDKQKEEETAREKEVQQQKEAEEQKIKVPSRGRNCHYCGKHAEHIKRCARCGKVQYCGRECQKKHWKEHKKVCQQTESSDDEEEEADQDGETQEESTPQAPAEPQGTSSEGELTSCKGCEKTGVALRKCPCHLVAYCSVQCQRNDWSKHRDNCTAKRAAK